MMAGIQAKLLVIVAVVLVVALGLTGMAHHFEAVGHAQADAQWLAKTAALRAAYAQKDAADQLHYQRIERETSERHEQELDKLRRDAAADRAAVDRAGGLRIDARACPAAGPAATPETAGTGGRDEAGAATIRIPQPVEDGLWRLADDADEVSAQLRACQGWIRAHGFYGTENSEKHELLDRMTAAQNQTAEAIQ